MSDAGEARRQKMLTEPIGKLLIKNALPTMIGMLAATTVYNQLRLCGSVKDGMIGLMIGMLCNIILDPILIIVLHMGIIYIPLIIILKASLGDFGFYILQPISDILSFAVATVIVGKHRAR